MNKERQGASRRSIGGEIYVKLDWHDEQVLHAESEIKRLQSENKTLRLAKDDFKKRLNDSGHRNKKLSLKLGSLKKDIRKAQAELKEYKRQAVKEFAYKLKAKVLDKTYINKDFNINISDIYKMIEETLKEYE